MPRQIAQLARAVGEGNAGQVRLVAHSIKGAASSVSGLEVQELAWNLEQMGSAGDLTAVPAALEELSASFERVRPVMETFSHADPAGGR
jgi:HPt (histidine-containing phosphotransfer) domain-containing protein